MHRQPSAAPLSEAQREIERVRIVYEEDAVMRRVQTMIRERLHETNIFEQSLALRNKVRELHDTEVAALNILEDTRALEEKLERERDRLSLIITSMEEGLVLIDGAYRILLANPAAANMLEIAPQEIPGINLADITAIWIGSKKLATEERFGKKALATGMPVFASLEDNVFVETRTGKKFPAAFMISPLKEHDGTREAVVMFRDITEKKSGDIK